MRNTVAKRIRKLVARDFPAQVKVAYERQEHKQALVTTETLNEKGQRVTQFESQPRFTMKLEENCQRAVSQYIKRNYNGTVSL